MWLRFPRVLGLIVCLYLVGMAALFGNLSTQSYRFVSNATATQGTVVSLEVKKPAGSQREPNVHSRKLPLAPKVTYVVAGKTYTYVAAHGKYHQRLAVGDRVTVLYDPGDPSVARLRGEGRVLIPLIASGFLTTAVVLGVVLYLTRPGNGSQRSTAGPASEARRKVNGGREANEPAGEKEPAR